MRKADLIKHIQEIGAMFNKVQEPFKARAFFKSVSGIKEAELIFEDGKLMNKIPGVGNAIKTVIEEFKATGTSRKYAKLVENTKNIKPTVKRLPRERVLKVVDPILEALTEEGFDWGYGGSIRRGAKVIRDVDVIVCVESDEEKEKVKELLNHLTPGLRAGKKKASYGIKVGKDKVTLDLNFCAPEYKGSYYLYFTGPRDFNIELRSRVKNRGLKVNEYGAWEGETCLASKTEEDMFAALGFKYVKPEDRMPGCLEKV